MGPRVNFVFAAPNSITSFDFSNAPKLKEVVFRVKTETARWMTLALQTITPDHRDFRQISIRMPKLDPSSIVDPTNLRRTPTYSQWMDLDRVLVQLWESHEIRPKVIYEVWENGKEAMREYVGCLFPEITDKGIIEVEPRILQT